MQLAVPGSCQAALCGGCCWYKASKTVQPRLMRAACASGVAVQAVRADGDCSCCLLGGGCPAAGAASRLWPVRSAQEVLEHIFWAKQYR